MRSFVFKWMYIANQLEDYVAQRSCGNGWHDFPESSSVSNYHHEICHFTQGWQACRLDDISLFVRASSYSRAKGHTLKFSKFVIGINWEVCESLLYAKKNQPKGCETLRGQDEVAGASYSFFWGQSFISKQRTSKQRTSKQRTSNKLLDFSLWPSRKKKPLAIVLFGHLRSMFQYSNLLNVKK
jgi:hypothetical protein